MKIIEIAIALILMYAVLSIIVSLLLEIINKLTKARGKQLEKAIIRMLNIPDESKECEDLASSIFDHPIVKTMNNPKKNPKKNRPFQYLDSGIFADALIDVVGKKSETHQSDPMLNFEEGLLNIKLGKAKDLLLSMYYKSGKDYNELKKNIEDWFNSFMERVTGWYKLKQRYKLLIIGFVIALGLNIDGIHMVRVITMDDELRTNLVHFAENISKDIQQLDSTQTVSATYYLTVLNDNLKELTDTTGISEKTPKESELKIINDSSLMKLIAQLKYSSDSLEHLINHADSVFKSGFNQYRTIVDISYQLKFPIGWNRKCAPARWNKNRQRTIPPHLKNKLIVYHFKRNNLIGDHSYLYILQWITGILLSTFLLSFGAPFWFDLLVRVVNIRKAGIKPIIKNLKK